MGRPKKIKPLPDPLAPPSKVVIGEIVKRFLKPNKNINWMREVPNFYRLWKLYPSLNFWKSYELPFGNGTLNMMTWFESIEGVEELQRAWLLYNYHPIEETKSDSQIINCIDLGSEQDYSSINNKPVILPRRPSTIAELLSSKKI